MKKFLFTALVCAYFSILSCGGDGDMPCISCEASHCVIESVEFCVAGLTELECKKEYGGYIAAKCPYDDYYKNPSSSSGSSYSSSSFEDTDRVPCRLDLEICIDVEYSTCADILGIVVESCSF